MLPSVYTQVSHTNHLMANFTLSQLLHHSLSCFPGSYQHKYLQLLYNYTAAACIAHNEYTHLSPSVISSKSANYYLPWVFITRLHDDDRTSLSFHLHHSPPLYTRKPHYDLVMGSSWVELQESVLKC